MELFIGSQSEFIFQIAETTEAENSKSALFSFTYLSTLGNVIHSKPTNILTK